jgi:hypothetical protein
LLFQQFLLRGILLLRRRQYLQFLLLLMALELNPHLRQRMLLMDL